MTNPTDAGVPIDARLVRKLADILQDTGLSEIEVERGDLKIRVVRALGASAQAVTVAAPVAYAPPAPVAPVAAAAPAPAPAAAELPKGDVIKSPMVGTVYMQPQPGAEPFCKVGDTVNEGQTLLIVEAMKTMNPISAPRSGKIVEILIADGDPIEFGEPLVILG
jgi:acetyl-CoA carboxylase biotin carboxyl carrier protein